MRISPSTPNRKYYKRYEMDKHGVLKSVLTFRYEVPERALLLSDGEVQVGSTTTSDLHSKSGTIP